MHAERVCAARELLASDARASRQRPRVRPAPGALIGFSKPFQQFSAEQTAELVTQVGWDGKHHEYPLGDRTEMLAHFRRDLKVLRDWLT